ncbi:MAG: glycosyltransferase [Sphingomonas sp.]|nr:glycosyltransferase [Sphingomonas sp.]
MTSCLIFLAHYLPSFKSGGPVRSIANLIDGLGHEFRFSVIASDRDALDETSFSDVAINQWNSVGKANVFYASPIWWTWGNIASLIKLKKPDVVYLNSFFAFKSSILPVLTFRRMGQIRPPVLLAPRGEFSPGALEIKPSKKWAFIALSKLLGLHSDIIFQASNFREKDDIARIFPSARILVASDVGPSFPRSQILIDPIRCVSKATRPLEVVFVSRITPKKNLHFAIAALALCSEPVRLTIFGPIRDRKYWRRCEALIRRLPRPAAVVYGGIIPHGEVVKNIRNFDLFFLPTRGENFGHIIPEAFIAGIPVLISDRTPWQGLEKVGVGWDLPLEEGPAKFAQKIDALANLLPKERLAWRKLIRAAASKLVGVDAAIAANREMLLLASERDSRGPK